MEQRLANTWRMTVNEKKFIETAMQSDLRIDGRRPFDFRQLTIKFGREDGSSEVQLGQTHVMAFASSQLVQPYRDRPNEGTLSIYTEFSPMADPSFEVGRPGESAVELGRIIDRGLRESRAVDTESLCVLTGKLVWAIRLNLHILDNGGNLVDASNIAALASLLTFRRPECTLGGEDGQELTVHPPEVREPIPLTVHHLPIAVTFGFIGSENLVLIDPTHFEESVMGGRMTATLNMNGDICSIQKAGGVGVMQGVIMRCLRIASVKAADITCKIKSAVESYNTERALRKIKHHSSSVAMDISCPPSKLRENVEQCIDQKEADELSCHHIQRMKLESKESCANQGDDAEGETLSTMRDGNASNFIGGPSSWDPYSKGVDSDALKASLALHGTFISDKKREQAGGAVEPCKAERDGTWEGISSAPIPIEAVESRHQTNAPKTLKDAVKRKKKKKNKISNADRS